MKFDYCSDLHLEFWEHPLTGIAPDPKDILTNQQSDNLIVAGDLCVLNPVSRDYQRYLSLLESFYDSIIQQYSNVYFVLGNHDHWGCKFKRAYKLYQDMMPKAHVLSTNNNYVVNLDDVVIVGDTLWSDLSEDHSLQHDMNDYRYIINDNDERRSIGWKDTTDHFNDSRSKIFEVVDNNMDKEVIVITHHCPSFQSVGSKQSYITPAYATDLEDQIKNHPNIKYWIHGHVHDSQDYMIGNTHILCNPRGYYGYQTPTEQFSLKSFKI